VDIVELLGRALEETGTVVDGVSADQMNRPGVGEWDVRTVIGHLVRGNENTAAVAEGRPRNPERVADVGDDPQGAYHRSVDQVKAAWSDRTKLDKEYESPFGPTPGRALLTLRLADNVTHGWDIAHATGQPPPWDGEVVQTALEFAHARLAGNRGPGGAFEQPVPVPDDAPAIDRLVAFLGRTP
jgi:uncharacterized protein (TIGR03086 family)